jgi:hypothetical protein
MFFLLAQVLSSLSEALDNFPMRSNNGSMPSFLRFFGIWNFKEIDNTKFLFNVINDGRHVRQSCIEVIEQYYKLLYDASTRDAILVPSCVMCSAWQIGLKLDLGVTVWRIVPYKLYKLTWHMLPQTCFNVTSLETVDSVFAWPAILPDNFGLRVVVLSRTVDSEPLVKPCREYKFSWSAQNRLSYRNI